MQQLLESVSALLHDFILGNLQQASIAFKADKMYLHHTPEKASFASPEKM